MPLPDRPHRHVDTSRSPTIASVEQFLRGGEASRVSLSPTYSPSSTSPSSPFFERLKHLDPEEDHGHYQKKSVLTKVKERAKKLRNSLIKIRQDEGNFTPSWGVSLEDDEEEEEEEDAEYLGAPMYESELAPEGYKENARQHPRANPVISEKHLLPSTVKSGVEQDREKPLSPVSNSQRTTQPATSTPPGPNKTMTETVAEKLTPAYAEGSNAAHSIESKIQGLAVSKPAEHQNSLSFSAPQTPAANISSQTSSIALRNSSAPVTPQPSSSSSHPLSGKNTSPTDQTWDKGVSVKEKTLSQVIPEALSPTRTPGDVSVMEKLRGAVNSLLRKQFEVKTPTARASSQIPASTSAQEVGQEENHGRFLQAN